MQRFAIQIFLNKGENIYFRRFLLITMYPENSRFFTWTNRFEVKESPLIIVYIVDYADTSPYNSGSCPSDYKDYNNLDGKVPNIDSHGVSTEVIWKLVLIYLLNIYSERNLIVRVKMPQIFQTKLSAFYW